MAQEQVTGVIGGGGEVVQDRIRTIACSSCGSCPLAGAIPKGLRELLMGEIYQGLGAGTCFSHGLMRGHGRKKCVQRLSCVTGTTWQQMSPPGVVQAGLSSRLSIWEPISHILQQRWGYYYYSS
jgi:hypothetical protein